MALLLRLAKFPASWMFGAMIASSVLHGTSLVEGGLPNWIRDVALVGIGALIGSRFARMRVSTLLRHVNAGARLVRGRNRDLGDLRHRDRDDHACPASPTSWWRSRPGAMDAMLALALTLHIDPIFVGAHHLSRFVFVSITTPGIVHLFGRPQEDVDD